MQPIDIEARELYETPTQQAAYKAGRRIPPNHVQVEAAAKALYDLDATFGTPQWHELEDNQQKWYREAAKTILDAAHAIIVEEC